jgi:hypothetical protein
MAKEFLREFRPCVLARYPSTAKRMSSGPGAASETVIIFDRFSIGRMELSAKPLILWRSLGDSNPCFRRERALAIGSIGILGPLTRVTTRLV